MRRLFPVSLHSFSLTVRAYLNTPKYGPMQLGGKNFGGDGGRGVGGTNALCAPPAAPSNLHNGRLSREQSGKYSHVWATTTSVLKRHGSSEV